MKRLVVILVLAVIGVSCGNGPPRDFEQRIAAWESADPGDYAFVYYRGGMSGRCEVRIHVRNETVADVEPPDEEYCEYMVEQAATIDEIFVHLRVAYDESDDVDVTYDDTWGYPAGVQIDRDKNAIDDEWGFGISLFEDQSE